MTYVRTFLDFKPPALASAASPFTTATIQEAATAAGTWVDIETFTLDPVEPDVTDPLARDLTTTLATLDPIAFYRIVWATASGAQYVGQTIAFAANGDACTIEQIDAVLDRGGTASEYTTAVKTAARDVATTAFEQKAGVAIRSVTRTDTYDSVCGPDLLLEVPRPLTVTALTIDGTSTDTDDVQVLTREGMLYRPGGWGGGTFHGHTYGRRTISVTYTHGYNPTPDDLSNAIAILAASIIKDGPFDDRGYGVTDDGGFVRLLTAGVGGASFSIPEVQAALMRYRHRSIA